MTENAPEAPDYFEGGRRCAVEKSEVLDDWWVGVSPRNGVGALVEGSWTDWVNLAQAILAENERRRGLTDAERTTA